MQLAGEWVFWETGNLDFLAFTIAMPGVLRLIGLGGPVIALTVPAITWLIRRNEPER